MTQHTKGPWLDVAGDRSDGILIETEDGYLHANTEDYLLMAQAGTVATECGLTPRQLLDQRNELLEALKRANTLAKLVTVGQAIDAGDDAIDAAGLNPWCLNEGQAMRGDLIGFWIGDNAIEKAEASNV